MAPWTSPASRYLVPPERREAPAVLAGFTEVAEPVLTVPHTLALADGLALILLVPTGLALAWRDAPASALVSSAISGSRKRTADEEAAAVPAAPARLVLRAGGRVLGSVPLAVGPPLRVPDHPGRSGVQIELAVRDWALHAGSLRGSGDTTSNLRVLWRRVGAAGASYEPPAARPGVLARLGPDDALREASA